MFYKGKSFNASICNKVGHKRYQFTIDGEFVYEDDHASLYDAIRGNEEFFTEEDYERAYEACEFLLSVQEERECRYNIQIVKCD